MGVVGECSGGLGAGHSGGHVDLNLYIRGVALINELLLERIYMAFLQEYENLEEKDLMVLTLGFVMDVSRPESPEHQKELWAYIRAKIPTTAKLMEEFCE